MRRLALIVLLMPGLAWAGEAKPVAENPVAEARLKHLAVELRCLVCKKSDVGRFERTTR